MRKDDRLSVCVSIVLVSDSDMYVWVCSLCGALVCDSSSSRDSLHTEIKKDILKRNKTTVSSVPKAVRNKWNWKIKRLTFLFHLPDDCTTKKELKSWKRRLWNSVKHPWNSFAQVFWISFPEVDCGEFCSRLQLKFHSYFIYYWHICLNLIRHFPAPADLALDHKIFFFLISSIQQVSSKSFKL